MQLSSPVTVQAPGHANTLTLTELDVTLFDNAKRKTCAARIFPFPVPLPLWTGDAYDAAGDYTQAQVEARILELLGNNPKAVLETLFAVPRPTVPAR